MLEFIVNTMRGTPWWVWGIFTYMLFIGFKSTNTNTVYLPRLFIIPAILIGLKYETLISGNFTLISIWLLFLTLGFGIGFVLAKRTPVKFFKNLKSIELPGNYHTLCTLMLLFSIKYFFGYLQATDPELALRYLPFETSITALFSGYISGRVMCYFYRFVKS